MFRRSDIDPEFLFGLIVLAIAILALSVRGMILIAPYVCRGILILTDGALIPISWLARRSIQWPEEGPLTSSAVVSFSTLLWTVFGLSAGLTIWVAGGTIIMILCLSASGLVIGLTAGATVARTRVKEVEETVEDHLLPW